jgi:N-acyl homoserine lactone hydrolase
MRVHVLETGRLRANETFLRADGWAPAILRRRADVEFPIYSFVVEHPEGTFAIDAGLGARVQVARWQQRCVPSVLDGPVPIDVAMRARGLDPAAVSRVILTHLDWDHAGGVGRLPGAEVLVHRAEYAAATGRMGAIRYKRELWPPAFAPTLFELDGEAWGPFGRTRALTRRGDVRLVGLPGHSAGQVGVVLHAHDSVLLFAADHMLRRDWFLEDYDAGRLLGLGIFHPQQARETSRRVRRLLDEMDAILLPSHDGDVPARLAGW